ncbi:hypothetical protein [Coleofasciculus sp. FACHB-712]|nr:hypothetical protein [Coleofasciculus sp. FACHB-712]
MGNTFAQLKRKRSQVQHSHHPPLHNTDERSPLLSESRGMSDG